MKEYTIVRRTGNWTDIPIAKIDCLLWSPEVPIAAQAQLCYDDDALYLRLCAVEEQIRAEENSRTSSPCEDSCLEFFFSPDGARYFNIEFNLNCCMYLGLGGETLVRLLPTEDALHPKTERTKDGWTLEYSVPFSFIRHFFPGFAPKSGDKMLGNFYKCGDLTVQEHYLAWNPITCDTPNFHRIQDFGNLVFA